MKIAYVVHDFHRHAGHSRYVVELAERFKTNHEVHVYANSWEEDYEGIFFHKVPAWTWKEITKVLTFIFPATWMIPKNFDIVHAQGLCGLRHDVNTVHIIQKSWLRELQKRDPESIGWANLAWKSLVVPLEKFALGPTCSKRVISISKKVSHELSNEYKIKKNIDLIYHGTDIEDFNPSNKEKYRDVVRKTHQIPNEVLLGIFVGNLKKGAATAIRSILPTKNFHLMLVSGSENAKEKKIVQELGLEKRVHWVKHSNNIQRYYAAADCMIFPTFFDTFGMVITEAMASGLPVITNRNAGASDLINQGVSGFLTDDPWDIDGISKYLKLIENNPDILNPMGRNAREAVVPFTWDKCAAETMECYRRVLIDKSSKSSP